MALSTEFAAFMFYRPAWFAASLKSQVVLLQTAHHWANAGVLLGARMHRERGAFEAIKLSKVTFYAASQPIVIRELYLFSLDVYGVDIRRFERQCLNYTFTLFRSHFEYHNNIR